MAVGLAVGEASSRAEDVPGRRRSRRGDHDVVGRRDELGAASRRSPRRRLPAARQSAGRPARACRRAGRARATAVAMAPKPNSPSVRPCSAPRAPRLQPSAGGRWIHASGRPLLEGQHHRQHPLSDRHGAAAARAGEQLVGEHVQRERVDAGADHVHPAHAARQHLRQVGARPRVGEQHLRAKVGGQFAVSGDRQKPYLGRRCRHLLRQGRSDLREHAEHVSVRSYVRPHPSSARTRLRHPAPLRIGFDKPSLSA